MKIHNGDAHFVLYFAFAQVVQERPPMFVFSQIVSHALGEKNVSGVAAVHYPLRHVETGAGKVGLTVHIDHAADRAGAGAGCVVVGAGVLPAGGGASGAREVPDQDWGAARHPGPAQPRRTRGRAV